MKATTQPLGDGVSVDVDDYGYIKLSAESLDYDDRSVTTIFLAPEVLTRLEAYIKIYRARILAGGSL